jgi:tetratricopeptide (TPR) repeat protein
MEPDFGVEWDIERPVDIERALRARLADEVDRRGELLTQIARAQGMNGEFADAHETLDRAEEVAAADPVVEVRCLLERGRLFQASGHPDRARPHIEQALAEAQAYRLDGYAVDASALLADTARGEEALAWRERAVAMAEARPAGADRLGGLYREMAAAYLEADRAGAALEAAERALAWWSGRERPDQVREAELAIARALRALGRHEEALAVLRRVAGEGGAVDPRVREEVAGNRQALREAHGYDGCEGQ